MSSFFCPACRQWQPRANPDQAGRERRCPTCRSLERHRTLALLLPALGGLVGPGLTVDVAPATSLDASLRRLPQQRRVRLDFDPAADGRAVDLRASVTDLPFPDASVQFMLCSHVLEHVPDDRRAMREIARVLTPTGVALVAVPIRGGRTDEDPSAPREERIRRFGQADHVRFYGDDFDGRLLEAGLQVRSITPTDLAPPEVIRVMRLMAHERFWLLRAPSSSVEFGPGELAAGVLAEAWTVIDAALQGDAGLARLAADGERLARQLRRIDTLRGNSAVRLLLAARPRGRRAVTLARRG